MTGTRSTRAAADAIRALISDVMIYTASGELLVALPYPELKAKAKASGEAAKWRISDEASSLLFSGKIGEGVTLDRTDIHRDGMVSLSGIEIEIN